MIRQWFISVTVMLLASCASGPEQPDPLPLPVISTTQTLAPIWQLALGEVGENSRFEPAVSGDFIASASARTVLAASRVSGAVLWRTTLPEGLRSGVAIDEQHVYVNSIHGRVIALRRDNGQEAWATDLRSVALAPPTAAFGAVVVRSLDSRIVALEPGSGKIRWTAQARQPQLDEIGSGRPVIVQGGVLVGLDSGTVAALRLEDGQLLWESEVRGASRGADSLIDVDGDLALGDEWIFASGLNGALVAITPTDGKHPWEQPIGSRSGVLYNDGQLFVADLASRLHALDAKSGATLWRLDALSYRGLGRAADTGAGILAIADSQAMVHLLSKDSGTLVGRVELDSPLSGHPVAAGDVLLTQTTSGQLIGWRVTAVQ